MPVAHLHVVGATAEQRRRLGAEVTDIYATVLDAPVERIRVFVVDHAPEAVTVAGVNCADGGAAAPFFTVLVFADRSTEQRQELLKQISQLLADVLQVDLSYVRGQIVPVDPDDWGIAGMPAAVLRRQEIEARAAGKEGTS
ncbi:MAG: 4-oxalocrotonate tautomerase [Propionibacterium sp.]|nr:4-oxalocrotonate tautomerase [Propionibacterium sp.]